MGRKEEKGGEIMKFLVRLNIGIWFALAIYSILYAASLYGKIGNNGLSWFILVAGCMSALVGGGFMAVKKR